MREERDNNRFMIFLILFAVLLIVLSLAAIVGVVFRGVSKGKISGRDIGVLLVSILVFLVALGMWPGT